MVILYFDRINNKFIIYHIGTTINGNQFDDYERIGCFATEQEAIFFCKIINVAAFQLPLTISIIHNLYKRYFMDNIKIHSENKPSKYFENHLEIIELINTLKNDTRT